MIPKQLQNKKYRFIKVKKNSKQPIEKNWQKNNNYKYNSEELITHLKKGGNYGILGGKGNLVIIDADQKQVEKAIKKNLPKTLTVKTGSGGKHYYFICKDLETPIRLKDTQAGDLGDVQGKGKQVIGPGSIHPNGNKYKVMKNYELAEVHAENIKFALREFIEKPKTLTVKKGVKKFDLNITDVLNTTGLKKTGKEYQGPHPVHGSKTGQNFTVNTGKNVWHCFRHDTGGDALTWLAVKEGILECSECVPQALKGKKFKKTLKIAKKKHGLKTENQEKNKKTVTTITELESPPSTGQVNFQKYCSLFKNHQHLQPLYELITSEINLKGKKYYPVKKALCYYMASMRQQTDGIIVGAENIDNRMNLLFFAEPESGKGIIKNLQHQAGDVAEATGNIHPEQLLGKIKKGEEKPGYLRKKALIIDEAQKMILEEQGDYSQNMREIRQAADPFLKNLIGKKTVDENFLQYYPETRFTLFSHPIILSPVFFDTGTYRRFYAFKLESEKKKPEDAVASLFEEKQTSELRNELAKDKALPKGFQITKSAKNTIAEYVIAWLRFTMPHANPGIRAIAQRTFFTTKLYFLRNVTILAIEKQERTPSEETVNKACLDTIHFLLKTFEYYTNNSKIKFSRSIWKTENTKEAEFLEWLYYNKAVSLKKSQVTIGCAKEIVQDIFGVNERQAASKLRNLRNAGLVESKQIGQYDSKIWITFNPKANGHDLIEFESIDLAGFLKRKLQKFRGAGVAGVCPQSQINKSSSSSSKGGVAPVQPLQPSDLKKKQDKNCNPRNPDKSKTPLLKIRFKTRVSPWNKGDEAKLPVEKAQSLINKGKAEEIVEKPEAEQDD